MASEGDSAEAEVVVMETEVEAEPQETAEAEPAKRSWAEARNSSHQMVLQTALEDLEAQTVALQQERDELKLKSESRGEEIGSLKTTIQQLQEQVNQKETEKFNNTQEYKTRLENAKLLEDDSKLKAERADRLEKEADSLREEISRLTNANTDMKEKIVTMETERKLDGSEVVPLKFQVQRLQSEIDTMAAHSKWLEGQLQTKNEQLADLKTSQASELAELRATQDYINSEKEAHQADLNVAQKQNSDMQIKLERVTAELRDVKQTAAGDKEAWEAEVLAERRLVVSQVEQILQLQQRCDDLVGRMEEMRSMTSNVENEFQLSISRRNTEFEAETNKLLESQADKFKDRILTLEKQLEDANARATQAEDGLLQTTIGHIPATTQPLAITQQPHAVAGRDGDGDDSNEPMGLTDLYARLSQTEDQLSAERLLRKKAEIRFARVEKDIAATAPLLQRQRQEYEIALNQREEYKNRMDDALMEMKAARDEASELRSELGDSHKRNREMERESQDLAKQVQTLLVSRGADAGANAGTDSNDGDGMDTDTDPAIPTSIAEMQSQNQRLLREQSRMEATINELKEKVANDTTQAKLEAAEQDISTLREDRKQQEVLVKSIVQQRDLYRALLNKHDSNLLSNGDDEGSATTALSVVRKQSQRTNALETKCDELSHELESTKSEISTLVQDKEVASDRLVRYQAQICQLTDSLSGIQSQLLSSKAAAARAEADSVFHKEKCASLEQSLERSKNEVSRITASKDKLQTLTTDLQKAVNKANNESSQSVLEAQQATSKLRMMEAQLESAKAAERRALENANTLRQELAKQGTLLESIQKIEASLSARTVSAKDSIEDELAVTKQRLENAQTTAANKIEELDSIIKSLEFQLKEAEASKVKAAQNEMKAKEDLEKANAEIQDRIVKFTELAKKLRAAKKKLGESDDMGDANQGDEEADLKARIATLAEELKTAKAENETLQQRVETFKTMAKTNEDAMKEVQKALQDEKTRASSSTSVAEKQLEKLREETKSHKEIIVKLTDDLASRDGKQQQTIKVLEAEIVTLNEQTAHYKKECDASVARYEEATSQLTALRSDLHLAQDNYERELALHATARTELRSAREDADADSTRLKRAEEKLRAMDDVMATKEALLQEEKKSLATTLVQTEKNLDVLRSQNDALHKQLATLTEQVEKSQINRLGAIDANAPSGAEGGDAATEEMAAMRKSITELREIIRFLRSDKDMVQASLDSSRRAVDRERASAAVMQRSLDDARLELDAMQQKLASSTLDTTATTVNALTVKFKAAEERARLLNDSNNLLTNENKQYKASLDELKADLAKMEKASAPMESRFQQLETEKKVLNSEKESLERELVDWKDRVKSLVSKFNQIDPVEHANALQKVQDLQKQVKDLATKKTDADRESTRIRGLAQHARKELALLKKGMEEQKKLTRKITSERDNASAKLAQGSTTAKELEETKAQLQKVTTERNHEKLQLDGVNERNDKLRALLRNFQKTIAELKSKQETLTTQFNASQQEVKKQKILIATLESRPVPAAAVANVQSKAKAAPMATTVAQPTAAAVTAPAAASKSTTTEAPKIDKPAQAPTAIQELPKVPPGGFKFGPDESGPPTSQAGAAPAAKSQKKRTLDESKQQSEPDTKKRTTVVGGTGANAATSMDTTSGSAPSSAAGAATGGGTERSRSPVPPLRGNLQRRKSADNKELSMKEKLLEKKRKLALAVKKKEAQLTKKRSRSDENLSVDGVGEITPVPSTDTIGDMQAVSTEAAVAATTEASTVTTEAAAPLSENAKAAPAEVAAGAAVTEAPTEAVAKTTEPKMSAIDESAPFNPKVQAVATTTMAQPSGAATGTSPADSGTPAVAAPAAAQPPMTAPVQNPFGAFGAAKAQPALAFGFGQQASTGFGASTAAAAAATPTTMVKPALTSAPAPATATFGQTSTFGGAAKSTFGGPFGSGAPAPAASASSGGGSAAAAPSAGSGAFLNMKPPANNASSAVQFSFGRSGSITLPTPSQKSPQSQMLSAFSGPSGAPFSKGGVTATPLFGGKPAGDKVANAAASGNTQEEGEVDDKEEGEMS